MTELPSGQTGQAPKVIRYTRVVHLSREIHPGIPQWPGDPKVEFEKAADLENQGYNLRRFSMGEHSGTHINAPNTFHADGASVEAYSPENLVTSAVVIDVRQQVASNPGYGLTMDDLATWEQRYGEVRPGDMVLLNTGWQQHWSNPEKYLGAAEAGGFCFPGFGYPAARYLLEERKAGGIGTDTPSVEPGSDKAFSVNKLILAGSGIVLENLVNLEMLPPTGATLAIGLLLLNGGTGSPASVLGLVP